MVLTTGDGITGLPPTKTKKRRFQGPARGPERVIDFDFGETEFHDVTAEGGRIDHVGQNHRKKL
jgi:hypothetical protein